MRNKQDLLPKLERFYFEDVLDEIELLGFPVSCSPFYLLQIPFRGDVMAMAADLILSFQKTKAEYTPKFISLAEQQGDASANLLFSIQTSL